MISYELIPEACHRGLRWATPQCLIFNIGVPAEVGVVYVPRYGSPGSNIRTHNSEAINLTTIDKEGERLNFPVGLIKADIEGTSHFGFRSSNDTRCNTSSHVHDGPLFEDSILVYPE
jgi:hypothetical protein